MQRGSPQYFAAKIGEIEARATTDAAKAKDDLIQLSESGAAVTDRHFAAVAERMGDAGKFEEAIALLDKGLKLHADSTHLDKLGKKLADDAKKSGDSGALDALAGLGYVGD